MSAAKRLALIVTLAAVTVVISAASVLAQGGAPNPSGGTASITPAVEDRTVPIAPGDFLSAGFPLGNGLRGWLISYVVSQQFAPASHRLLGRTLTTATLRRFAGR